MSSLFEDILPAIFTHRAPGGREGFSPSEVEVAMDVAVQTVDPRIRILGDYADRLRPAVEKAIAYANSLVERIPGVLEINSRTFATDPRVNAFFVNVDDLRGTFSRSSELRDFLSDQGNRELEQCCALLCMKRTERSVLGMALEGEQVRRDVQKVTVSFEDHQVISPGSGEAEVRQGLKACLFQSLMTNAVERLAGCHVSVQQLEAKRRSLQSRLRSLGHPGSEPGVDSLTLKQDLAEVETSLGQAPCRTPEHSLQQLLEVLSDPERFVRLNTSSMNLDRLGTKLNDGDPANRIDLAEVELGNGSRRVVVLARFPRQEMLPQQDLLANMSHYLQI